jgi:glycosyltransferase involved in cell wall biosynthesis
MTKLTDRSTKPRLWVVSELYYPEQTSTGYFLTKIAEGLAADFDVQAICGQPSYSERGIKAPSFERHNNVDIHRMKATHFDKDKLLFRLINVVTMTLATSWFLLRQLRSGDQLLVVTNPPILPPVAVAIASIKGCRPLLLVHDVFPESLAATRMLSRSSIFFRLMSVAMRVTYRAFARVIVLGRDMRQLVHDIYNVPNDRIAIIPNWGDSDEVVPIDRVSNAFAIQYNLVDKVVIQFSGNIGLTHDIGSLIHVAGKLRHLDRLVFLFVGYGGKTPLIEQAIAQDKLTNIVFVARQPREMLGAMLACADATVIAFEEEMLGISVPSRMYNVMSAATPIIAMADPKSELSLCVAESDSGWVVSAGDREMLQTIIETIALDPQTAKSCQKGKNGRANVQTQYTLEAILDQYRAVLLGRTA